MIKVDFLFFRVFCNTAVTFSNFRKEFAFQQKQDVCYLRSALAHYQNRSYQRQSSLIILQFLLPYVIITPCPAKTYVK